MPRLTNIDPTTDTGAGADLLNGRLKAKQINIYKGLAAHPSLFEAFVAWGKDSKGGGLTPQEGEVVQLLAAEKMHCEYCTAAHTVVSLGLGLTEDDCLNIRRRHSAAPKDSSCKSTAATCPSTIDVCPWAETIQMERGSSRCRPALPHRFPGGPRFLCNHP